MYVNEMDVEDGEEEEDCRANAFEEFTVKQFQLGQITYKTI